MKKKLFLIGVISILSFQFTFSQENTKLLYNSALDLYERGQADKAVDTLRPFLEAIIMPKTDKNTLANIYRVAALSYLVLKDNDKAKIYTKLLLETNPYYDKEQKLNNDFKRLRYFVDSLKWFVAPKILVGIKVGINPTFINVVGNENSLFDVNPKKTYSTVATQMHAELFGEYFLTKHFSLTLGTYFSQYQYKCHVDNSSIIASYNSRQQLNYIEVPLDARYYVSQNKFRPYVYGGLFSKFLVSAVKTTDNLRVNNRDVLQPFCWGISGGLGVTYKQRDFTFFIDSGLMYSFTSITQKSKLFYFDGQTDSFMHRYYDLMDDITLHSLKISVGVAYTLKYKVFN